MFFKLYFSFLRNFFHLIAVAMRTPCSIRGCKSVDGYKRFSKLHFYYVKKIRRDPKKLERWRVALNYSHKEMDQMESVCSLHFCNDDYLPGNVMKNKMTSGRHRAPRLKDDAVPHLKLVPRGRKRKADKTENEGCSTNFEQIFMPDIQIKVEPEDMPTEDMPTEDMPPEDMPPEDMPTEDMPTEDMSPEESHFASLPQHPMDFLQIKLEPEDFSPEEPEVSCPEETSYPPPQNTVDLVIWTEPEDLVPQDIPPAGSSQDQSLAILEVPPPETSLLIPVKYRDRTFCSNCRRMFKSSLEYDKHFMMDDFLKCKFCNKKYKSATKLSSLMNHVRKTHGNLPFCGFCKEHFEDETELEQHVTKCNICRTRKKYNKNSAPVKCDLCWRSFRSKAVLAIHIMRDKFIHLETICKKDIKHLLFYERLILKNKIFQTCMFMVFCPHCKKDFFYNQYFKSHFLMCYKNCDDFICPLCNIPKSRIMENIEKHIYNHLEISNKIAYCEKCKFTFYTEINYNLHMAIPHKKHDTSNQFILRRSRQGYHCKPKKILVNETINPIEFSEIPEPVDVKKEVENTAEKLLPPVSILHSNSDKGKQNSETKTSEFIVTAWNHEESIDKYFCKKCNSMIPKKEYADHLGCHVYRCSYCTRLLQTDSRIRYHLGMTTQTSVKQFEYLITEENRYSENGQKDFKSLIFSSTKQIHIKDPPLYFGYNPTNCCKICDTQFQFHCQLLSHNAKKH